MSGPLVSAIVPVYNGERFLAAALDSILAQNYSPLEVIVVDDGSTDRSAEIAQARPVRYIFQENAGVAAARNTGLAAATGELIAFLDQDDVWCPGKLAAQVQALVDRPELGLVLGRVEPFLEPGAERPRWMPETEDDEFSFLLGALVIRKSVFEEVGGFDPSYETSSDADWFARLHDFGVRREAVAEIVLRYRVHEENASHAQHVIRRETVQLLKASIDRKRALRRPPLVSVVIPAHNAAAYLGEALESVFGQGHEALDLIVVDDGSTDATAAVAERYGDRLRIVRQAQAGIGPARNSGVELARGDFLAFLDADDLWEPRKLERQLAALARPQIELVFGHVRQFASPELEGAEVDTSLKPAYLSGAALMRMEVWRRVGLFGAYQVGEFMDWLLRARELGVAEAMLPDHVLSRRVHATNQTRTKRGSFGDYAQILKGSLDRRRALKETNA
jgi:glycosyltransferase involved in cell wall biosynthesis